MPDELKESLIEQMGAIPLTGRLLGDLTLSKKKKVKFRDEFLEESQLQLSQKDLFDVNYPGVV